MGDVQRISERASPRAFDRSAAVDADAGTIGGVVICGFESANKRRYPWREPALAGRIASYEGARVNLNHSKDGRTFQEWVGVIRGVAATSEGCPGGRIHLFKSDPYAAKVLEAARACPEKFGLSHVVRAKVRRDGGVDVVEDIEAVESVDIVVDPASTKGLFEGIERETGTLPQLVEWACRNPAATTEQINLVRWLAEDMAAAGLADAPADVPADASGDADAAISAAFESAISAIVRQGLAKGMDRKAVVQKVRALLAGHEKALDAGAEDKSAESRADQLASQPASQLAALDKLTRENAVLRLAKGVPLTEEQFEALAAMPSDDKRRRLLESFKAAEVRPERPAAAGRMAASELLAATEGTGGGGATAGAGGFHWQD